MKRRLQDRRPTTKERGQAGVADRGHGGRKPDHQHSCDGRKNPAGWGAPPQAGDPLPSMPGNSPARIPRTYAELLRAVKQTLLTGQREIEIARVLPSSLPENAAFVA